MNRVGEFFKDFDFKKHLWMLIAGGVFGFYLLLLVVQYGLFNDKVGIFTKVAGVNTGGMTKEEVVSALEKAWLDYSQNEVRVGKENKIMPAEWTQSVAIADTYDEIITKQRKNTFLISMFWIKNYDLKVVLNEEKVAEGVQKENSKDYTPGENANIVFDPEIRVVPEKYGRGVVLESAKKAIQSGFGQRKSEVPLSSEEIKPSVFATDAQNVLEEVKVATADDLNVVINNKTYKIAATELRSWVKLDRDKDQNITFFDTKKLNDWVSMRAKEVDSSPANAQLAIKDGKLIISLPSKNGFQLNQNDLIEKIQNVSEVRTITGIGEVTKAEITEETITNLGIKEQISVGYTDFSGSPANRIHNVRTGASKFNGAIVKPGEKFSFNTILGPVDASTGYLEELVIINNKTEKQFGGGLCQVSSTAFRAALNAGLPILERSPHSYPVVYYKPYGVDASIYLPKPDFVFQNDTGQHILIQTKIVGNKLYFEFYGTKAARTVKFSGNADGNGAVEIVEKVDPYIYDQEVRGRGSFTAVFYRHIYDLAGKLTDNDKFTSKYDSPDKYPH